MIKYALICKKAICQHEFEAWFSNSADYDQQEKARQLICPLCQSTRIEKAIMAPAIKSPKRAASTTKTAENIAAMAAKLRANISKNCEDVGDKFADEARAIHYGEKPERGIYGQARPADAKALIEEGVGIVPLPDMIVPNSKKTLN